MKFKFLMVLLLVLFTAACSSEEAEDTTAKKEESVKSEVVKKDVESPRFVDLKTLKSAVPALVNELNKRMKEVKLPATLDNFYNYPLTNATIEKDKFSIYLSLEDTIDRRINLSVSNDVKSYQKFKKDGYSVQKNGVREYLVSPKENELFFIDGEYLYHFDTISIDPNGKILSLDEIKTIAEGLTTDSEYKDYFIVDLEVYKIPTYFTHDGKEPYRLYVGYGDGSGYFLPSEQSLQISNDTAIFEQASLDSSYKPFAEEINIDGQIGYLSYGDNAQFDLVNGENLYTVRLATIDVNQKTGRPYYAEVPNWQQEVSKIIKSLNLPAQQEDIPQPEEVDTSVTDNIQQEREKRLETIEDVYIESTLADSVFNKRALQFNYMGPEIAVGYIQDQLFKRFIHVNKKFEKLNITDLNTSTLSADAANNISQLLESTSINPKEVFLMKDKYKGEKTLYWLLQIDYSVTGYRVINIYDAEKEMYLSDF
ncbi:hypothetical protein [Fredinandcohnia quinoae]|uniref:Lipoprotein n=1 Tax=Fredinandcohnia quinoae TaxID=2918902 RepID=A0AAW5EDA7_9BACI|nr:hypothetical protein [Fredinandcohnia sp. SECRCQ15]MCH1627700.1 hypothetical protein [Fredinandcohnia sp. SECRCQ15]